jgi:trk system potassium uptake protein TrkH
VITLALIIGGALILFLFELRNVLDRQPFLIKILVSLFQSITCRTAGFNTVNIAELTDASLFFIILLMFIGASPGSCGGGIKTTTAGVVFAMLLARSKNQEEVNIGHHRIPGEIVSKAISVTFVAMAVVILATILLMMVEHWGISHQSTRGLFLESFFEVISAFGTVGLSTGITPELSFLGKLILVIVMFIGRVGPLTVVLAVGRKIAPRFKYAQENVLIG